MNKTALSMLFALSTAVAVTACGADASQAPLPATPVGTTGATALPATGAAAAVTGTFNITPQNSKIEWTGAKTTYKHPGSFTSFSGKIDLAGPVEQGKVSVDIDTPSIAAAVDPTIGAMIEKLTGHLKSPDFFDVGKFPKASFASTGIKTGGDNGAPYTVSGNLTIRGVTKPISFPATITASPTKVDATATFTINRKDFGITIGGKPEDPIKDEVEIRLTIHADKG
jgi:polyisoprenoid-binding protein YceI